MRRALRVLGIAALLAAPGIAAGAQDAGDRDPIEPVNRIFFEVNRYVLDYGARPAAIVWRTAVPGFARDGFRNVLENLNSPLVIGNQLLQGEAGTASRTTARFLLNSTAGLGGAIDVAGRLGIRSRGADLGQTLGVWGIGEGAYLVLPFFGPTTVRDAASSFAQGSADPFNQWVQRTDYATLAFVLRFVLGNVDLYARRMDQLDAIEATSVDFYAALRNLFLQKRRADIAAVRSPGEAGAPADIDYGIDYGIEPDADGSEVAPGDPDPGP